MLHIDGNVDKKFKLSIYYRSRENRVSSIMFQTDISNSELASLNVKHAIEPLATIGKGGR